MATKYSLICWGGYAGSASWSRTANQLTKTNHGLNTNGTVVYFSGGTLPTSSPQVDTTTPYYVKVISTSAIELYTDSGLTSQVTFSATGSGWVLKSQAVVDPATFFAFAGLSDLSRWDAGGGSYRIYDGIAAWASARASAAIATDYDVCEIAQPFIDLSSTGINLGSLKSGACDVHTNVNGYRTPAFHYGVVGAGYVLKLSVSGGYLTLLNLGGYNRTVDGLSFGNLGGYGAGVALINIGITGHAKNNILQGAGYEVGINIGNSIKYTRTQNNLVIGCAYGITYQYYNAGSVFLNNTVTKCGVGFSAQGTGPYTYGYFYNNISYGNTTTNWAAINAAGLEGSSNNAGGTGEAWTSTGGTRIEITEASPYSATFVDWTNNDFRPTSGSQLIDAGVEYYGILPYDIAGDEVPNYNNGGSEAVDIGAYEYDHGYGPHPASTTVTFSGVPAGSEIRVYDSSGTELAGVESSAANPVLTWAVASGAQRVVIVNLAYRIREFAYTNQAGAQTVPVQMDADQWYENP